MLKAANLRRADPIQFDPRPSYVYRWYTAHAQHLSAMGSDGYDRQGALPSERVAPITPHWDRDWVAMHKAAEEEARREPASTQ